MRAGSAKPWVIAGAFVAILFAIDVGLGFRFLRYRAETARLRNGMSEAERQRSDMEEASEDNKVSVMLELLRRQASGDRALHLAVSIDSGLMRFERDGALLREIQVEVGPEHIPGNAPDAARLVRPRGARTVERILGPKDDWNVPEWVFAQRGFAPPPERKIRGALGRGALVLSGGTVIYALPDSGVLADSSYVLPGAVRMSRADLRAITPNISPGLIVYFYE